MKSGRVEILMERMKGNAADVSRYSFIRIPGIPVKFPPKKASSYFADESVLAEVSSRSLRRAETVPSFSPVTARWSQNTQRKGQPWCGTKKGIMGIENIILL